jgi:hypothetical protein
MALCISGFARLPHNIAACVLGGFALVPAMCARFAYAVLAGVDKLRHAKGTKRGQLHQSRFRSNRLERWKLTARKLRPFHFARISKNPLNFPEKLITQERLHAPLPNVRRQGPVVHTLLSPTSPLFPL